jgi:hypothetical protein
LGIDFSDSARSPITTPVSGLANKSGTTDIPACWPIEGARFDDNCDDDGRCRTFQKVATAAGLDAAEAVEVVRWTEPPGPNSRTTTIVSVDAAADADAARAARPMERMVLIVFLL